jgi:hypothetical protein
LQQSPPPIRPFARIVPGRDPDLPIPGGTLLELEIGAGNMKDFGYVVSFSLCFYYYITILLQQHYDFLV